MYSLIKIDFIFIAGLLLFGSSCKRMVTDQPAYFNTDSLIRAQAKQLTGLKASLTKQAQVNGDEETASFIPKDSSAWMNELDIFTVLNSINKPVNRGNYIVLEETDEDKTNLMVRTISGKADLPVVWMKIYYQDTPRNIRRIEALYREASPLVKGSQMLMMEFREINHAITLVSYSMEGGKQMFLGTPVEFSIIGTITTDSWQEATVNH